MTRIDDLRVLHTAEHISTHNPWFVEYIREWRKRELDRLAYNPDEVHLRCGRIQVLDEVLKVFDNAAVDLRRTQA